VAEALRLRPQVQPDADDCLVVDLDLAAGIEEWDRTSSVLWADARRGTCAAGGREATESA
jgi:hypothetical protein